MIYSELERPYVFTTLDTKEPALIAQSERVKAPFINRENLLLEILNTARETYTAEQIAIIRESYATAGHAQIENF